ncbi:CysZ protein [Leifsonia sp. AK011]|uniref:EI24 domain-containing protein n=1 Tax=Leifsonia sp. AK011 TaxID=2723075 RepID=UPI0015C76BE4|nr:EI24 domain-containing protein [Leifsonia sp. AK011]NYF10816.1 CysZ protein [Leifsonia sp. AK011]
MAPREGRRSPAAEFFSGVGLLFRGLKVWGTAPRLMILGMIPALIVGVVFLAAIITLGVNLESFSALITPFAERWDEPFRTGTRLVAAAALLTVAVLIVVFAFTTITLIVGQPFYELIWKHAERRFGPVPESSLGFWRAFWRGVGAGLRILVPTVLLGLMLFVLGFIPVVGQILVPVLGAVIGGWYLTLELTGLPFDARGFTLRERRAALRSQRAATLGFGAATYLVFLVPLGAVVMMPAAVAGATLLARRALREPTQAAAAASGDTSDAVD